MIMRPAQSWLVVASLLPLVSPSALHPLDRREASGPAVITLDTVRKTSTLSPAVRDRLRRRKIKRDVFDVSLDNEQTLYFANVTLGTPGQLLRLDIDTGSSDIWANSASSDLCRSNPRECTISGVYDANQSSSYQYVNSEFQIKYADGSFAVGDYALDTMEMGDLKITDVPFGIGYDSTSSQGILGVGYATNVASVGTTGQAYRNLPLLLVDQKAINSASYSLWLNDLDANTGSIMFGGVDMDKYNGELQTLPIVRERGAFREFVIAMTSLTAAGQTVHDSSPIPVLLDSGSSLTYLPDSMAAALFTVFKARYMPQAGVAVIDCGLRNRKLTVDFEFSGVKIQVPLDELVLLDSIRRGQPLCIFGISSSGGSTNVLGDTFLRSAYVVYDLENNQISLAQTNFNATSTRVKEISSGENGVPGASLVANAVSTLSSSLGNPEVDPEVSTIASLARAQPTAAPVGAAVAAAMAGIAFAL